eukprot:m.458122 g.458122  ORF g.458122 m.458122 type:complete len:245 (+) comp56985_c0_seq8:376-1110(+)
MRVVGGLLHVLLSLLHHATSVAQTACLYSHARDKLLRTMVYGSVFLKCLLTESTEQLDSVIRCSGLARRCSFIFFSLLLVVVCSHFIFPCFFFIHPCCSFSRVPAACGVRKLAAAHIPAGRRIAGFFVCVQLCGCPAIHVRRPLAGNIPQRRAADLLRNTALPAKDVCVADGRCVHDWSLSLVGCVAGLTQAMQSRQPAQQSASTAVSIPSSPAMQALLAIEQAGLCSRTEAGGPPEGGQMCVA